MQKPPEAVTRFIPTTGIHNFRDFGGYPVRGGGKLVGGRLYRCGDHSAATAEDLALVASLKPSAFVDLRGRSERLKAPCRRADGFGGKVYYSDGETATIAPHIEAASGSQNVDDIRREMTRRYEDVPFRPYLIDVYKQYLRALEEAEGATIVYCSAGKDRTGVLVAIVQSLIGVHDDDIMTEYLLTNDAPRQAERIAALRGDLEARFGTGLTDEAVRTVTGVEPIFLDAALARIRSECGSVENYARQYLGFDNILYRRLITGYVL
jgi:protein tyrosine/serine phosphatase